MVSRDATHFVAAGVPMLDPWSGRFTASTGDEHVAADLAAPDLLARLSRIGSARG